MSWISRSIISVGLIYTIIFLSGFISKVIEEDVKFLLVTEIIILVWGMMVYFITRQRISGKLKSV